MSLDEKRVGDWFETYNGGKFWAFDPRPIDIDIEDIANSLSKICRFNGHCKYAYSVAQHSVHVCNLLEKKYKLFGLLHDASEAYIADIVRPVKKDFLEYIAIEQKIEIEIGLKFNIDMGEEAKRAVKWADDTMLATEAYYLLKSKGLNWTKPYKPLLDMQFGPWLSEFARDKFLETYYEITKSNR